ncbi:MAG: M23 family metallopeptidase [Alistipes sp.]|nr:M23 family metallopeptidase [Alistipes sp.]
MRRLLTLILLFAPCLSMGQHSTYIYPIEGVAGLYSANFGEMRPGHFHAGIDIKTDGVEGKRLVAAADGYISRIVVQAGGYGRALYLTTADGTTIVYAHMQRFRDDIDEHVRRERYRRTSNSVDLWPAATRYPVQQGDFIGYSGNSGSSSGPHLHNEMRRGSDQARINIIHEGIITPRDTLPPRFMKLHYVEVDTLANGIPMRTPLSSYALQSVGGNRYRLAQSEPLEVGRKGYFIAEVTDRRNGVHNTFSIWRLSGRLDDEPFFEFRIDHFPYELSRTCDVVSCYPLQLTSRNEAIRLAQMEGAPRLFYPTMVERGLIRTAPGEQRRIELELEDDCGNRSTLGFDIIGRDSSFSATPPADTLATPLYPDRSATLRMERAFTAHIPAGALYEACYARPMAGEVPAVDSGVVVLSPAFRLFAEPRTPLHKNIRISIRAEVPQPLQAKAALALRNYRGQAAWAGGSYADGEVSGNLRSVGDWFVVADTLPPTIQPLFKAESNLSTRRELRFKVSDNFTGIASWRLEIDGEWVPCDRYPSRGQLIWHIDQPATGTTRRATLTVTDGVGNRTSRTFRFRW